MSPALHNPLTDLPQGATLRIDNGRAHVIDVFEGQVWLTLDGDARDLFLEAGESFTVEGHGLALLQALRDSRVLVSERAEGALPRPMNAFALHRWARARRDAALAALIRRAFAAAESTVQRGLQRLSLPTARTGAAARA
jgi:hypothetical protein